QDIEVTPYGKLMIPEVEEYDRDGEYYTTQKLKAALPNGEYREQISLVPVEIMNDVKKPGSDYAGYEGIKGGIGDELRVWGDISAEPSYDEDRGEKCDDHHQAVTPYGQRCERYFEKLTMHLFR
ncbi:unnamed protein product, partial [marine sediment metagenome]